MHFHHVLIYLRSARRSAILKRTAYYVYKEILMTVTIKGISPNWGIYSTVTLTLCCSIGEVLATHPVIDPTRLFFYT